MLCFCGVGEAALQPLVAAGGSRPLFSWLTSSWSGWWEDLPLGTVRKPQIGTIYRYHNPKLGPWIEASVLGVNNCQKWLLRFPSLTKHLQNFYSWSGSATSTTTTGCITVNSKGDYLPIMGWHPLSESALSVPSGLEYIFRNVRSPCILLPVSSHDIPCMLVSCPGSTFRSVHLTSSGALSSEMWAGRAVIWHDHLHSCWELSLGPTPLYGRELCGLSQCGLEAEPDWR